MFWLHQSQSNLFLKKRKKLLYDLDWRVATGGRKLFRNDADQYNIYSTCSLKWRHSRKNLLISFVPFRIDFNGSNNNIWLNHVICLLTMALRYCACMFNNFSSNKQTFINGWHFSCSFIHPQQLWMLIRSMFHDMHCKWDQIFHGNCTKAEVYLSSSIRHFPPSFFHPFIGAGRQ